MDDERKAILEVLNTSEIKIIINTFIARLSKSDVVADQARLEGNALFERGPHGLEEHEEIWQKYSLAISVATPKSEKQALGYANRSALLYHLKKYQECIVDIDRAVSISKSWDLKAKWLCRKAKCLVKIGDSKAAEKTLDEAKGYLAKVRDAQKKKAVQQTIKNFKLTKKNRGERNEKEINHEFVKGVVKKNVGDFEDVEVKYNSEYGRYLIAKRDFQPGEVVFVEKPYISIHNLQRTHAYCGHCLKVCWTMIPCDHCSWCMFCSEKCKTEAWSQYHDDECIAFGYCARKDIFDYDDILQLSLRLIITECRKAGGVKELRNLSQAIDKNKENYLDHFTKDGSLQSHGFQSQYNLSDNENARNKKLYSIIAVRLTISLAKYTTFFGKKLSINECKNLSKNEDALFIASLIFKFLKISNICGLTVTNTSYFFNNRYRPVHEAHLKRGYCLATIYSLINYSCNPNVSKCFTEDNNIIVFTLQTIKKNSQLFINDMKNYYDVVKLIRQPAVKERFGFICKCRACEENWPPLKFLSQDLFLNSKAYVERLFNKPLEKELFEKFKNILIKIQYKHTDECNFTEKMILDLVKSIKRADNEISQPSLILCLLTEALKIAFERVHSGYLHIPNTCKNI